MIALLTYPSALHKRCLDVSLRLISVTEMLWPAKASIRQGHAIVPTLLSPFVLLDMYPRVSFNIIYGFNWHSFSVFGDATEINYIGNINRPIPSF